MGEDRTSRFGEVVMGNPVREEWCGPPIDNKTNEID
jgi:hypothetical protein